MACQGHDVQSYKLENFWQPLKVEVENVEKYTLAAIVLHSYLHDK